MYLCYVYVYVTDKAFSIHFQRNLIQHEAILNNKLKESDIVLH